MNEEKEASRLAAAVPKLTEKELQKLNDMFPAYIFRRRHTGEIWTSCCGKYVKLPPQEWDDKISEVMNVKHEQEGRAGSTRYCHYSAEGQNYIDGRELTQCPFCGKPAAVKELGRTGNRQNLRNWQRGVIFRQYRGALWAKAYECEKNYEGPEGNLIKMPAFNLVSVYRFQIGKAERSYKGWYESNLSHYESMAYCDRTLKMQIHEPFHYSSTNGMCYDLLNLDDVQKSEFKYCELYEYAQHCVSAMKFLTIASLYPRQTEMLMKAGMYRVVKELAENNIRNSRVFDWEKANPFESFGLSKQELKEFSQTHLDIKILRYYKRLKKNGEQMRMAEIEDTLYCLNEKEINSLFKWCRNYHLKVNHVVGYLERFTCGCHVGGGYRSFSQVYHLWQDYLTAADALHYEIWKQNIMLPSDLFTAHDEATAKHRRNLEKERRAAEKEKLELQRKKYNERLLLLQKKYAFTFNDLTIVVPKDADEIVAEGKALQHCVGGYAGRHMSGTCTILFLRHTSVPEKSFVTIEMDVNRLIQIHGFKNEGLYSSKGRFAPDPRVVHAEFLDLWLDWLKRGSPRDKEGNPVARKARKKKEVTAA